MPRQCDPRRNGGARQGGGFLEGEMARYVSEGLLSQNCVFCEHPVEIGSEPIGAVIGLDRPTEPPRVEATGNSVANLDPCDPVADGCYFTRTVGKRHDAEFRRTDRCL